MANQYRLKKSSRIIQAQAEKTIEEIKGAIKKATKQHEMFQLVFSKLRHYFTNLGKPSLILRPAPKYGPPVSDDYNSMMAEIKNDLDVVFTESDTLTQGVQADFNFSETERELLKNRLVQIEEKTRDFEIYYGKSIGGIDVLYARDAFKDTSKIDKEATQGALANISTAEGLVTLAISGAEDQAAGGKLDIIPGQPVRPEPEAAGLVGNESNGFAGNNHEVVPLSDKEISAREDGFKYRFVGEENNHARLDAIVDHDSSTWFEYEAVNISDKDKQTTKGYGLSFQVTPDKKIRWDFDPDPDGVLRLMLRFTLPEPRVINWISFNPYIPPNSGAMPAKVASIHVAQSDDAEPIRIDATLDESATGINEESVQVYSFPKILAKRVDIRLEQPSKFSAKIGHFTGCEPQ